MLYATVSRAAATSDACHTCGMGVAELKKCSRCKKVWIQCLFLDEITVPYCAGVVLQCAVSAVSLDERQSQKAVQIMDHTHHLTHTTTMPEVAWEKMADYNNV